ncbi:MAG: DNA alkylation repair protein [Rhizobiaceae bacterium]
MADPSFPALKEIFDRDRFRHIAAEAAAVWPAFDGKRFMAVATKDLAALGIMQRVRRTATALHAVLPEDFDRAASILRDLAPRVGHSFAAIALSEYVALYGRNHFDRSMQALRHLTRYGSSEFAIRHFLVGDFDRTLAVMRDWADDDNEHVRRLASEGSRPRLPWSFQLKNLIVDPSPTMPILEALRADGSPYVRKSVANHLNDIGKDHPAALIERVSGWDRGDPRTAWIVRHALRTLIKKGEPAALSLVGATGKAEVAVRRFTVEPARIELGERIAITATLASAADCLQRLVVDYAVHYARKGGAASRKVFKLKEIDLPAGGSAELSISQAIRDFSTRKHHPGRHVVELLVNGETMAEGAFDLRIG